MQHVIIRIGRPVVHGEGWYGEAAGRIIIQDMLPEGSGEHVLWSPDDGGKIICGVRAIPKGGYMDGTGGGKPPARSGTY